MLHADQVFDVRREAPVEVDEKVHRGARLPGDVREVFGHPRRRRRLDQKRRQLAHLGRFIFEGDPLRVGLEKKIERIQNRHLGDEIYLDAQLPGGLRENDAR